MRRLLVICALSAAIAAVIIAAFWAWPSEKSGPAWHIPSVMASSTGSIALRAAASAPGCPLGPAFTFCNQTPGTTSATEFFTLTATSAVTGLALQPLAAVPGQSTKFAAGDFTVKSNTCGATLGAGATCTIGMAFTPSATTTGLRAAGLAVTDAAKDTAIINLNGTAGTLAFAPPAAPACTQGNAFTFCDQALHTPSTTQNFTLSAGSTVTGLTVTLAAVPGLTANFASADFILTNGCGTTLVPGTPCTVDVQFDPTIAGLRSAALTATDTGGDSVTTYLAGNTDSGLAIAPPALVPACSPGNAFEFCNTPTGGAYPPEAFTLQNTSGVQLTGLVVPATSVGGSFTVTSTSCVAVLPPAGSCILNVAFTPAKTGLQLDALQITDAAGDIRSVILAGTGDTYVMALAATQPVETSVVQGGTAAVMAVLLPDNVFGQDGEKVTFLCPATLALPINTSCAVTPCPASIIPATPANITITLVTSSRTVQAPLPAPGCSSYGPPPFTNGVSVPPAERQIRGPYQIAEPRGEPGQRGERGERGERRPWLFPTGISLALLAALGLAGLALSLQRPIYSRRRTIFAAAAMAAVLLSGCHKHSPPSPATPVGTTSLNIQAIATDASGNSLNTSRVIQGNQSAGFILDVIPGT